MEMQGSGRTAGGLEGQDGAGRAWRGVGSGRKVKILMPSSLQAISVLEKFSATVTLASCIIPDELILKQLEVYFSVLSLHAHFSPLIYGSVIGLIAHFKILQSKSEPVSLNSLGYLNIMSNGTTSTNNFCFSISANLESVNVHVNLENDGANSSVLMLSQRELDIRYGLTEFEECMVSLKALNISTYSLGGDRESHNLCSSYKLLDTSSGHQHDQQFGLGNKIDNCGDSGTSIDECFLLHYEASRSVDLVRHKCTVFLNDVELHCYPYIFGLLVGFYDKISGYGTSSVGDNLVSPIVDVQNPVPVSSFGFQRFGFSNYFETGSSEWASIPLNNFPFVTIKNSGSLGILESSLFYAIPEWRKNFNLRDRNIKRPKFKPESDFLFKLEIVDSTLILPVKSNGSQFLNLDIQQLYCSFMDKSCSGEVLRDIPPECLVQAHEVADKSCSLNVFGRDLSLSLLLFKDDAHDLLMFGQDSAPGNITFIAPLSVDVWVRIPWESETLNGCSPAPMCVMVRVCNCQLIAEDGYIFSGFEALIDVIFQFSSIDEESKCFTSDVLQFLHSKRSLRESRAVPSKASNMMFTEARCFVNSLSIKFCCLKDPSISFEPVAKADMQFVFSASLRNEIPLRWDICFSSLSLYSLPNCLMLVHYVIASGPLDPLIEDKAPLDRRKNVAVSVSKYSVPSLSMSSYFVSQTMKQNAILNMKSDNIAITFHIPVWVSGESFSKIRESAIQEERPLSSLSAIVEGEHSKFIEVTLQSRNNVLIINGSDIKVKSCLEQMSGSLQICEDKSVHSWPFFHLFQVNVEAEICNNPMEPVHVKTVVQCDNLDVWLSRQVFHFWHGTGFKIPEAGSSQFTFSHVYFEVQLRKLSLLLTDERWSCNGPLLEILTRNLRLQASITEENMDGSITGDLQVNYNNIHKVLWEPFVEPWMFQIDMIRSHRKSSVLNSFITTDINLKSTAQLNLNFTESLVEALFRVIEMIKDAWGLIGLNDLPESNRFLNRQIGENECIGRYVPYILQNLTSLPLVFHVYQDLVNADDSDVPAMNDGKFVQPGHSVPIYINETPEEQMLRFRPVHSSDRLNEKQSHGVAHHFITIQLDGTSVPSNPLSMDLVGLTYFEVDFSKASNKTEINTIGSSSKYNKIIEENHERDANSGFVVPVVFDVSIQRYSKLVRLYSTVILMNATSKALELRFDIPFGVSPKILDPIYPGQEFPLPLHLAESGRIRWRPLGSTYLWSEAYKLSDILSQENRIAFLRSFVCYPSHPSNDPFRCCLSVQDVCLPSFGRAKKGSYLHTKDTVKRSVESGSQILHNQDKSKKRLIHQITLSTPLIVNNYLPEAASLTIESGGVTRSALLSEVETSFFHIDSSQDLGMVFHMHGFKPSVMKFPRTETFTAMAKFSGTKFSLSETMILDPDLSNGPTYLTVEKVMDAFSGARELCIFVPFLLYNCTGFSLIVSDSANEMKGNDCTIPSCYTLACMYSPNPNPSESETMVRVRRSECLVENTLNSSWSSPFSLVPPSGSCSVLVPQPSTNAAFILSVTSSVVDGPFAGRTRAITFQPRYVISNACSKDLCYKQKGTDFVSYLGVGQHSHLHWTDTSRDLLVSICFNGPGWQWSGSFLPDHLGDTQVKMRNYVSGALNMIRVEVQNADISIRDEKIIGSPHGNSGTNLILLSDDDTGFMPYRIDNFSKERLRIYQQRCETFETIVHSYTSCPYAWDEPCYPHRLTVEVPGERVVGSYALDNVKEYMPICLPSTSEKPERTLVVSVHAEGAMKVLSIMDSSYHILKDMKVPSVRQFREKRKHDQELEAVLDYKEKISVNISFIGISLISSYPQELLFACAKNTRIDLLQSLDHQKFSFQISSLQIDNQLHTTPYPVVLSFDHEYRSNPAGQIRTNDNSTMIQSESVMQVASDSSFEPVFCLAAAKWRNKDISLVSFEYISLRVADFRLELEQEVILSLLEFFRTVSSRFQSRVMPSMDSTWYPLIYDMEFVKKFSADDRSYDYGKENGGQHQSIKFPLLTGNHKSNSSLPSIVPIGAPWQQIYLLAGKQRKIYVEVFDLAPIKLTLSFSSTPWMLRNGILTSGESLIHRGLMALADIEGAQIYLKQLTIMHHMASLESIEEILTRHYTRQLLHEMYKVFGSAGVIGNPVGFIRSVGLGIKDFLSAPARSVLQSPTGLITGMAQGTTSLLSSTVYAISDAATQFSKAAHKGIVAFTFDDQAAGIMEKQQKSVASHSKGVINELLEGLTGLLQSPIKGAEKHGLPGVLSGVALGLTGLVARPAASILEVTGKTAQSIRNRSRLYQMGARRLRVRLPRPLSRELPLMPYSWEEAVGASVLADADDELRLKEEVLITCKALKQDGKFFIITERLILIVSCSSLVGLGKPEFQGVPATPEWVIEAEIGLESVIHADTDDAVIHIVGSSSETMLGQTHQPQRKSTGMRTKQWNNPPTPLPFFQTSLEFVCKEDAEELLQILLSAIEQGKERGWGSGYLLHQSNLK
uniref:Vacuolar protein sorting-associated protein 13 VPS13 adaptor binding domain-containing protein n=1 Tax=Vitis vinifera TaxID=29760 RepID=F6I5I0_VITVI